MISDSAFKIVKKFCYLSHPVYDVFLWQPRKQIRVEIKNLQKEFNGRFKQAEEKKSANSKIKEVK